MLVEYMIPGAVRLNSMIPKSWLQKSVFQSMSRKPKMFARRPTRAGSFGLKRRRYVCRVPKQVLDRLLGSEKFGKETSYVYLNYGFSFKKKP